MYELVVGRGVGKAGFCEAHGGGAPAINCALELAILVLENDLEEDISSSVLLEVLRLKQRQLAFRRQTLCDRRSP